MCRVKTFKYSLELFNVSENGRKHIVKVYAFNKLTQKHLHIQAIKPIRQILTHPFELIKKKPPENTFPQKFRCRI